MNKPGLLGELLEQGKSGLGDTGRAIKGQLSGFGKAAANQISPTLLGKTQKPSDEEALGQNPEENTAASTPQQDEQAQDAAKAHAKDVVKHLYGVDDTRKDKKGQVLKQSEQPDKKKILSEEEKIQQLQGLLHHEYYQGLTKPPKPQEEERPAEKVEKEEKMEDLQEQEKEKKKPPPLIARAQQKVEKFPGASG